jgi:hypothetical protein
LTKPCAIAAGLGPQVLSNREWLDLLTASHVSSDVFKVFVPDPAGNSSAITPFQIRIGSRGANDFNRDGVSDALWRNASGETDVWLMNNGLMKGGAVLASVSTAWRLAGIGIVTNDQVTVGTAIGAASTAWQPQVIHTG